MTGVTIDFQAKATSAKSELNQLNKKLAEIVRNAFSSSQAMDGVFNKRSSQKLNQDINKTTRSFKEMGKEGAKSFQQVNTNGNATTGMLNSVRNAALAVASAFLAIKGVGAFNQASDSLVDLHNKLKLVEKDMLGVYQAQRALYQLSKDTRSDLGSNVSLYVDLTKASERFGASQQQVMQHLRTLQQMAALSGSSVESIKAAFVQLGQGIASGTIRGEELNSVLEQFKFLGFELQNQLKMNAGELRKFAEQGGLTTQKLFEVLENAAERTEKTFNSTVIKTEQAVVKLRKSISLFAGELSATFGLSGGFAQRLVKISDSIDTLSDSLNNSIANLQLFKDNFVRSFSVETDIAKTVNTAWRYRREIWQTGRVIASVSDIYEGFVRQRVALGGSLFKKDEIEAETKAIEEFQKVAAGGLEFEIPKNVFDSARKETESSLRDTLKNLYFIGGEIAEFFRITFDKITGYVGATRLATRTFFQDVFAFVGSRAVRFEAQMRKRLFPVLRTLESINDTLSIARRGRNVERAFVDIFRSDGLDDFREKLAQFNNEFRAGPTRDWPIILRTVELQFHKLLYPIQDLLVNLNILDNRFVFLRKMRLDKLVRDLQVMGESIRRVYQEILAPNLAYLFNPIKIQLLSFGLLFRDIISDMFTKSFGEKLANFTFDTAVLVVDSVSELFRAKSFGENVRGALAAVFNGVANFTIGFFGQLGDRISDSISLDGFEEIGERILEAIKYTFRILTDSNFLVREFRKKMGELSKELSALDFDILFTFNATPLEEATFFFRRMVIEIKAYAISLSAIVLYLLQQFGKLVKAVFFDIYDAVVGHSYWPDMIDGIIEHTERLFGAETTIGRFADNVSGVFSNLYKGMLSGLRDIDFSGFAYEIANVNWSHAFRTITSNLLGALTAAFALFSDRLILKIGAVGFFASLFDQAFDGASVSFAGLIAEVSGETAYNFVKNLTDGLLLVIDKLAEAVPDLVSGFLSGLLGQLGTFGEALATVVGSVFNNSLLSTLLIGAGIWSLVAKNGAKDISNILFGKKSKEKATKGQREGGLLQYFAPLWASSDTDKLKDSITSNKLWSKEGALAGAVFASAFLTESITVLGASFVGIPLLIDAFLGGGKGMSAIQDTAKILAQGFLDAFAFGIKKLEGVLSGTAIGTAFTGFLDLFRNRSKSAGSTFAQDLLVTPLGQASVRVKDAVADVFDNIRANRQRYLAKEISFEEMLFGANGLSKIELGSAFLDLGDELRRPFHRATEVAKEGMESLRDIFTGNGKSGGTGIIAALTEVAASALSLIGAVIRRMGSFIATSLQSLSALLSGKGVIVLLALGTVLANVAQAGETTATVMGSITDEILRLVGATGAILGAAAVFGALQQAFVAFNRGRRTFIENAQTAAVEAALPDIARQRRANIETLGLDKANDLYDAAVEGVRKQAKKDAFGESIVAGFAGLKEAFPDLVEKVKRFGRSLSDAFKAVKRQIGPLALDIGNIVAGAARFEAGSAIGLPSGLLSFFTSGDSRTGSAARKAAAFGDRQLFAGFEQFSKGMQGLAEKIGKVAQGLFTTIGALAIGLFELLKGVFDGIKEIVSFGLRTIWQLLGGFLKRVLFWTAGIAAGVSAVGAIGLWLFGPEGSLGEKIEWAIDQVRTLFGLQPKGGIERFAQVFEKLNSGLVGNSSVSRVLYGLTNVDLKGLSATQFKNLDTLAGNIGTTIEQMQQLQFEQGGILTDDQLRELDKAAEKFERAISRLPTNEKTQLELAFDATISDLKFKDRSLTRAIDNYLGRPLETAGIQEPHGNFTPVRRVDTGVTILDQFRLEEQRRKDFLGSIGGGPLTSVVPGFAGPGTVAPPGPSPLKTYIDKFVDEFGTLETLDLDKLRNFEGLAAGLVGFEKAGILSEEQVEQAKKIAEDLRIYERRLREARDAQKRSLGLDPEERKLRKAELDSVVQGYNSFIEQLSGEMEELLHVAGQKNMVKLFEEAYAKLAGDVKGITGVEIDPAKTFLSQEAADRVEGINDEERDRQNEFEKGFKRQTFGADLNEKILREIAKRRQEFIIKASEQDAFFRGMIERLSKSSGLDIGDEILVGYATSSDKFQKVIRPALEVAAEAQQQIEELLRGDASPAAVREAYINAFKAQGAALETLRGNFRIDAINANLQAVGAEQLSDTVAAQLSEGVLVGLNDAAIAVRQAKLDLGFVDSFGIPEASSLARKDLVKQQEALGQTRAQAANVAAVELFKDTDNLYNAAQRVATVYGVQIPEGIQNSTAKMREWVYLQLELNQLLAALSLPGLTPEDIDRFLGRIQNVNRGLSALSKINTIDSLLGNLSNTGIDVTIESFGRLGSVAQAELISIGKALDNLYTAREQDISSFSGGLEGNLRKEAELLSKARSILEETLFDTGQKVIDTLGSYGLSELRRIAQAPTAVIQEILRAETQVQSLQYALSRAYGAKDWEQAREIIFDIAAWEKAGKDAGEAAAASISDKLGKVNDALGIDLDLEGFATLPTGTQEFFNRLTKGLEDAKLQIEDGLVAPETAKRFFDVERGLKGAASAMERAANGLKDIARAGTVGVGRMFETVSQGIGEVTGEFLSYLRRPRGDREQEFSSVTARKALLDIAKADDLPNRVIQALNRGDVTRPEEMLRAIQDAAGKSLFEQLSRATMTPMGRLTSVMETLVTEVRRLTGAITGKPVKAEVSEVSVDVEAGKDEPRAELRSGFFSESLAQDFRERQAAFEKTFASAGNSIQKLFAVTGHLGDSAEDYLDFPAKIRDQLTNRLVKLSRAQSQYNIDLVTGGKNHDVLRKAMLAAEQAVFKLIDGMHAMRAAAERFTGDMRQAFNRGLSGVLKGDTKLSEFGKELLDRFTSGIVDSFSEGITDLLFTDLGLGRLTDKIGGDAYGLGRFGAGLDDLYGKPSDNMDGLEGPPEALAGEVTDGFFSRFGTKLKTGFDGLLASFQEGGFFSGIGDLFSGLFDTVKGLFSGFSAGGGGGGFDWTSLLSFIPFFAEGGKVSGPGTGTSDSVMAMVSNGEYVVNAEATKKHLKLLNAINFGSIPKFAAGGLIGATMLTAPATTDIEPVSRGRDGNPVTINLSITGDISRQTKKEIYGMIPQIANGVNSYNRENGV